MGKMKSKKPKRLALGLGAATFMCATMAFSAVPALAAGNENMETVMSLDGLNSGTETWYAGSGFGGDYTFNNNNTTPVKTMGNSGTLRISGSFHGADGYSSASPIKLTVEIRSTSGAVLARTIAVDDQSGSTPFSVSCNVSAGQKIQIFFDASSVSNPPGIYREAHVTYYHYLY